SPTRGEGYIETPDRGAGISEVRARRRLGNRRPGTAGRFSSWRERPDCRGRPEQADASDWSGEGTQGNTAAPDPLRPGQRRAIVRARRRLRCGDDGLLYAKRRGPATCSSGDQARAEARRAAHLPRVLAPRGRLAAPAVRLVFLHLAAVDWDQGLRGQHRRLSVPAGLDPFLSGSGRPCTPAARGRLPEGRIPQPERRHRRHPRRRQVTSILYIFLPCKQIYPVGCTYLADYIHKRHPEVRQRILDLSQIPHGERAQAVRETAENVRPDLVCFSWRDIQIF